MAVFTATFYNNHSARGGVASEGTRHRAEKKTKLEKLSESY